MLIYEGVVIPINLTKQLDIGLSDIYNFSNSATLWHDACFPTWTSGNKFVKGNTASYFRQKAEKVNVF